MAADVTVEQTFTGRPIYRKRFMPPVYNDDQWELVPATPEVIDLKSYGLLNPPPVLTRIPKHNQYICTYTAASTNFIPTELKIYYMPFMIPYPLFIRELGVYITTREDDKKARLGIFAFEQGLIGELIYSNVIALNTLGYRAVEAQVHLVAGAYMLAYFSEASTAAIRISTLLATFAMLGYDHPSGTTTYSHYFETGVWADGFSSDPTPVIATGSTPHIWVKV